MGKRHGNGTSFYNNQAIEYIGSWVSNEKHGNGELFSDTGALVFAGIFHLDEIQFEEELETPDELPNTAPIGTQPNEPILEIPSNIFNLIQPNISLPPLDTSPIQEINNSQTTSSLPNSISDNDDWSSDSEP